VQDKLVIFAITKNGRRFEDINYISRESAQNKLNKLIANSKASSQTISNYRPKYDIVETLKPNKIW
tara:strand:- start:20552 stop:20749 length:198 start_codon:yes stop_codon:yes gene_type:complete